MLRRIVGNRIEGILTGIALFLHRHKITPNNLTLIGLIINGIAAYCYYRGFMIVAGIVVLLAGFFDMLDGAVARAGDSASKIGAFNDSVVDRYSDFLIFAGVLTYFAKRGELGNVILVLVIICGAFLVSYVRARSELVIPKCAVGLMERAERIIILAAGSIFNFLIVALWFLAISTHFTAFHRIYYTHKTYKATRQ
jgi:phosphatidylglycerophosphate synthase